MSRSIWFLAGCALLLAAPALAATALDGWNGYKFGLSPNAARAVPGISFGRYSAKNLMNEDVGAMRSTKDVLLNGRAYGMTLYFNAAQKLNRINLENQIRLSRTDCERRFLDLMGAMEKTYGSFAAVNPQRPRNDTDKPSTALEWRKQGASGYQLSTVYLTMETVSAWKARYSPGGNRMDIDATWSGASNNEKALCLTDVEFSGK